MLDMVKPDKNLGERVKDFRLNREMTQVDSAIFFRVSLATIARLEAGKGCSDLIRRKIEIKLQQQTQAVA